MSFGFLGSLSFEKTKVPDVLILLGIGVLLGPVLGLLDPTILTTFTEYFGSLALIIILFEGGMDMDVSRIIKGFSTATLLVVVSFALSCSSIAAFFRFNQGWGVPQSLLLGGILGCTSAAIVIPIVAKMSLTENVKTVLSIESALSDVFAVVMTVALIEFIQLDAGGMQAPIRLVANSFSVAILAGLTAGLLWLKVLDYFKDRKYSYMLTLSAVLIVFAIVQFLGGSGPIAILIFGIVLGNAHDFARFFKLNHTGVMDETLKFFHGEVTFFIRTFFFVYLGMILSFKMFNAEFALIGVLLTAIIFATRYVSVWLVGLINREKKGVSFVMLAMLPRGLASAVLATLPVSSNIAGSENFIDYTFAVIVLTNIVMTVGVFIVEKKNSEKSGQLTA